MKRYCSHGLVATLAILFLLLSLPGPTLLGKTKKQSKHLPPEVLKAKSVYLDNGLDVLDTSLLVKQRLQDWGRFRIENRPEKADLILTIRALGSTTALLTVRDSSYRRVFWSTPAVGDSIPGRCLHLIDLFQAEIEADEASQRQAAPPLRQR